MIYSTAIIDPTATLDEDVSIGAYAVIGSQVKIESGCRIGNGNVITNSVSLAGHVEIGDQCNRGGFPLAQLFTRIGSYVFTSIGAAINRDVPPFVIASGNYARSYGINKIGLRRKGFSPGAIKAITRAYKFLVRNRVPRDDVLRQLERLARKFSEVQLFADFIVNSTRGITR